MFVYHLKVAINLGQDHICKSEVYSTLEIAIKEGKKYLEKGFIKLYNSYKISEQNVSLEQIINLDRANYKFTITELDPQIADSFNNEKNYLEEEPTHKVYVFKYDGTLKYTSIIYMNEQKEDIYSVNMYEEDLQEGAGEKFKVGDIVSPTRPNRTKKLLVVTEIPKKEKGQKYFDNTYMTVGTYEGGCIYKSFKESEIEKVTDNEEIPSKISILQRIIKKEIKVSKDEFHKIRIRRNKVRRIYIIG